MILSDSNYLPRLDAEIQGLLAEGCVYDAIGRLDGALGVVPRTPGNVIAMGTALLLQRDMEGALRHFTEAVAKHFAYDHARYGKALALRALGRAAESEAELKRALQISEDRRRSLSDAPCGPIYYFYMKHEKIIRWAYIPDMPLYHLALGDVASAERMVREASGHAPAPLLMLLHAHLSDSATIVQDSAKARSLAKEVKKCAARRPK